MVVAAMKRQVDDKAASVQRVTRWASRKKNLFYLSSCDRPDAANLGTYELVVAQGIRNCYVANTLSGVDWNALKTFCNRGKWTFFVLSYDLNRCLTDGLSGNQRDALGWPLLYFIEPEQVVTVSRQGEMETHCQDSKRLLQQLAEQRSGTCEPMPTVSYGSITASASRDEYVDRVIAIKEQIAAGNFYEINLCLETVLEDVAITNPFSLHQQFIDLSPTPFSSYVQLGSMHLLTASPERFLKREGRRIYSQPIKGTAARHIDPAVDEANRQHLSESLKERAEHVMIVDLMRNDLGRLCEVGSIAVSELCEIYGYQQVYQMVSTIAGDCRDGVDFIDVLKATFPMGSMTGAPKNIVMEQIEQIEPAARGWFSGSVGYIKPCGDFDSNVVIRSILYDERQRRAKYSVGSAITFDSDPDTEYCECLLKATAIRQLLNVQSHGFAASG